jgi:hypothetical protein
MIVDIASEDVIDTKTFELIKSLADITSQLMLVLDQSSNSNEYSSSKLSAA